MEIKMNKYPKTLIYDIETSPCKGWFWGTGTQYVGAHNIREPGKIICVSYRYMDWEEGKVEKLTWDRNQCDKKLVQKFYKVAQDAELIVGHNGDGYDKKWINARLAYHKLPTIRHLNTEDTLKQVRRQFKLPSYKLDFLCKYFEIGGKIATSSNLWEAVVFDNNRSALKDMVEYCDNDVLILEELYRRIYPYVDHKYNLAVRNGTPSACPQCGEDKAIKNGFMYTKTGRFQKYICKSCGFWYRDGHNMLGKGANFSR